MSVLDSVSEYVRHQENRQHVYDVSGHEGHGSEELCMPHARAAKTLHSDSNVIGLQTGLIKPESHDPDVQVVRPHQGRCVACGRQLQEQARPSNVGPRPPVSDVTPGIKSPYTNRQPAPFTRAPEKNHVADFPIDKNSSLEEDSPYERQAHQERLDPRAGGRNRGKGQDPQGQVAPHQGGDLSSGSSQGSELRPLREHPQVDADLRKVPTKVQDTYFDRVDALRRGERHSSTHPLNGPLKGWHGTSIGGNNWRMIHRSTPDGLEVKAVGQHQPAYEQAIRRTMAKYFTPSQRIFTHTCGLDHRLWDENSKLRPEVRSYIMQSIAAFWGPKYRNWSQWSRVYFAGSEASEWTSDTLEGNSDFDVLVGVDYDKFREDNPEYADLNNQDISDMMNHQFRDLNNPNTYITVDGTKTGPWDRTTYVNTDSYDIRKIKPYAAYDVGADYWVVKPPHLPHWDIKDFPKAEVAELHAIEGYVKSVLRLPEPERTQQGAALFEHLHSDRSRAFSDRGEGWYDVANVAEKYLDQEGLWAELVNCKHRADEGLDKAPADWSNTPPGYTAALDIIEVDS